MCTLTHKCRSSFAQIAMGGFHNFLKAFEEVNITKFKDSCAPFEINCYILVQVISKHNINSHLWKPGACRLQMQFHSVPYIILPSRLCFVKKKSKNCSKGFVTY